MPLRQVAQEPQVVSVSARCYHPFTCTETPNASRAGPSLVNGFCGQRLEVVWDTASNGYRSTWHAMRTFARVLVPARYKPDSVTVEVQASLRTSGQFYPQLIAFAAASPNFTTNTYPRVILGGGSGIFKASFPEAAMPAFDASGFTLNPKVVWICIATDREAGGQNPFGTVNQGSAEYYEQVTNIVVTMTSRISKSVEDRINAGDMATPRFANRESVTDRVYAHDVALPDKGYIGKDRGGARDDVRITRIVRIVDTVGARDAALEVEDEFTTGTDVMQVLLPRRHDRLVMSSGEDV